MLVIELFRPGGFAMTNDSRLGLLTGVAAVLLIAVVYYQKGTPPVATQPPKPPAVRSNIGPVQIAANTPVLDEPK